MASGDSAQVKREVKREQHLSTGATRQAPRGALHVHQLIQGVEWERDKAACVRFHSQRAQSQAAEGALCRIVLGTELKDEICSLVDVVTGAPAPPG